MRYAIIESGFVANIAVSQSPLASNWIPAANAKIGYRWDGSVFAPVLPSLEQAKVDKSIELAAKSEEVSTEDLTVDGVTFTTDNESVADMTTALSVMGRNPTESIDFKGANGWTNANKAALENMQNAVWVRRKAANANYKAHDDAITLLTTPQEVIDYDINTGWPE